MRAHPGIILEPLAHGLFGLRLHHEHDPMFIGKWTTKLAHTLGDEGHP